MLKTILAATFAAVLSTSAIAQTAARSPAAPATTAPATPAARSAAAPRPTLPAGTTINLNTATADQLDALPSVGKARAKAILDERAKSPFKDWADFDKRMQHSSVNRGVKAKIKDSVTF